MTIRLSLVMINWNSQLDTIACVQSLVNADFGASPIIIVDNGSSDSSVVKLRTEFGSRVTILESNKNLGFARGINWGIEYALTQGAEWVFILNNDTIIQKDFFAMVEPTLRAGSYSIVGPLIYYYDDPERVWFLGDSCFPSILLTYSYYKNKKIKTNNLPFIIPVDFVTGCGMFVHRAVFETIGLFDTRFFMYAEDADFCWRARLAGFRVASIPRARMWHKVSASANRIQPLAQYWRIFNQIRFYRKHSNGFQKVFLIVFTFLRSFILSILNLVRGRWALLIPITRAWFIGWFGPINSSRSLN